SLGPHRSIQHRRGPACDTRIGGSTLARAQCPHERQPAAALAQALLVPRERGSRRRGRHPDAVERERSADVIDPTRRCGKREYETEECNALGKRHTEKEPGAISEGERGWRRAVERTLHGSRDDDTHDGEHGE